MSSTPDAAARRAFEAQVAPLRPELLAHCYRMTGARSDAEDALQDALVRAWRAIDGFEARASMRTWLYRVTTNACLDLIADRRARTLPELVGPAAGPGEPPPAPDLEPRWLEPYPDDLLGEPAHGPDVRYARRESVRLAFVVALHVLPARQRATLILRDVVGLSAEETAEILETSVAATTSALQRARAALDEHPRVRPVPTSADATTALLSRYVQAWESGDAARLITVLREDAILTMPPIPMWFAGREAIVGFLSRVVWAGGAIRMVACAANGSPAFGIYKHDGARSRLAALSVLELDGGAVAQVYSFLAMDPALDARAFGLPKALPDP
jgi:RNA polymerase sigma-70 factor, ECF subfamily